jgi:hypothetical protein
MILKEVTKDDLAVWKTQDVTKAYFKGIQDMIAELKEMLADGATIQGEVGSEAKRTAFAVGSVQALIEVSTTEAENHEEV